MRFACPILVLLALATSGCNTDCTCEVIDKALLGSSQDKIGTLNAIGADKLLFLDSCVKAESEDKCKIKALLRLAEHVHPGVRHAAMGAASSRRYKELVPIAKKWLEGDDAEDKEAAVWALTDLEPKALEPHVVGLLDSRYVELRIAAANAAGELKLVEAGPVLIKKLLAAPNDIDDETYEASYHLDAIVKIDRALLRTAVTQATPHAEDIVTRMKEGKDTEGLMAALGSGWDPARHSAVEGLGSLKAKQAVPALAALLTDVELRFTVVAALGSIGDKASTNALVEFLKTLKPGAKFVHQYQEYDAIQDVIRALEDSGDEEALGKVREYLTKRANKGPKKQRAAAAKYLETMK
jgi:HEAT repeat protein